MRRKAFLGIVLICLVILIIQTGRQILPGFFGLVDKGGLKVLAMPDATVYLNGSEVGKTPFQDDNLTTGEYLVKLISNDSSWQGKIFLTKGTLSVINRSLAPSIASSSGESLVLDKGMGVTVTSSPSEAEVEIDAKLIGKTPLFVPTLTAGVHNFTISRMGYNPRKVDVVLPQDLALHIDADLSLSTKQQAAEVTPTIAPIQKVIIKQTQLGYLRLRESPSISSKEVGQVSAGEELLVVSESPGWIRVRLKDNSEGYVSAQYAQKITVTQ